MSEFDLAFAIADRAVGIDYRLDKTNVAVVLLACHRKVVPLKLEEMLTCPEGCLMHDIYGIARHLDLNEGVMRDCFLPRLAA